jgi:hypothetical protein
VQDAIAICARTCIQPRTHTHARESTPTQPCEHTRHTHTRKITRGQCGTAAVKGARAHPVGRASASLKASVFAFAPADGVQHVLEPLGVVHPSSRTSVATNIVGGTRTVDGTDIAGAELELGGTGAELGGTGMGGTCRGPVSSIGSRRAALAWCQRGALTSLAGRRSESRCLPTHAPSGHRGPTL